ncbi:MAG: type II secretion system protein [Candidatus Shapirobacteria bacterium]|nr:type II secretion system protein [Candidatus Shapirobacteria bacterium]MDD4410381.1 type II secretion system protein [Candidatus Shapirobacteria bacterium]
MKQKNGFTLVELLIGITIVVILAIMMIGAFNAVGITNKARDARRKKDLNRIKIALEEYFNNRGEFPQDVATWNIKSNCGKNIPQLPTLSSLPCDPKGEPYFILVEVNKFRIITDLENKKDKDIPDGWYSRNDFQIPLFGLTTMNVNYGVSSTNILWYEDYLANYGGCNTNDCLSNESGVCNMASGGCSGNNCYYMDNDPNNNCDKNEAKCKVSCCGTSCD